MDGYSMQRFSFHQNISNTSTSILNTRMVTHKADTRTDILKFNQKMIVGRLI